MQRATLISARVHETTKFFPRTRKIFHIHENFIPRKILAIQYALVGGAISIRDPYICAVSRVCANELHAVFHGPVVCAVKT